MEEQNKSKVVKMNASNKGEEKKKLTYDQLGDACNQLFQQNQMLRKRNNELEGFAMNKRLDYLFKVLEFSKNFSSDFVGNCASEIEEAMTIIPQNTEETKDK